MGGVTAWRWCAEWYSGTGNEGGSDEAREGQIQDREQSGGRERRRAKRVREERGRVCGGYGSEEREDGYRGEEREDGESGQ